MTFSSSDPFCRHEHGNAEDVEKILNLCGSSVMCGNCQSKPVLRRACQRRPSQFEAMTADGFFNRLNAVVHYGS